MGRLVGLRLGVVSGFHSRRRGSDPQVAVADAVEGGWLRGILFRIGCAMRGYGADLIARDCLEPDQLSVRQRLVHPEVSRRLERQRDAMRVQLAGSPMAVESTKNAAAMPIPRLRRETVSTRYRAMAQDILRELARLGDAAATPGFDVLIGREPGAAVTSAPPLRSGLFALRKPPRAYCYGTTTGNAALRALLSHAEQTKRRAFDAAMSLCSVAVSIRNFHRALLTCREQVRRHYVLVTHGKGGGFGAEQWLDIARMVVQTECIHYLHEFVIGVVPLLLCSGVTHPDQRLAFRRSIAHSLWCISEQMQVFH